MGSRPVWVLLGELLLVLASFLEPGGALWCLRGVLFLILALRGHQFGVLGSNSTSFRGWGGNKEMPEDREREKER